MTSTESNTPDFAVTDPGAKVRLKYSGRAGVAGIGAFARLPLCALLVLTLAGCDPVSLTVFGVGAATGVQHTLTGITYRTFTAPLARVRSAVDAALEQMAIELYAEENIENGKRLKARVSGRDIEIELEALTPRTTRMRSTARNGPFMDSATATEIIIQTEKALAGG
jgi:hypothetical protein